MPINGIYLPGSTYYKAPPYPSYSVSQAKKTSTRCRHGASAKFTLTYVERPIVASAWRWSRTC